MSAVLEYLQGRGVTFVVIPHGEGRERALTPGVDSTEPVKTVVLVTRGRHVLAVVPDSRAIDLELARTALDDPEARPASAQEVERSFPHYDPGALPPLGPHFLAPMYVDPAVALRESVAFRAGSDDLTIAIATNTLFRDASVVVTPLTIESAVLPGELAAG